MSLQRVEILWSPNNSEEFATYCTELSIYRLHDGEAAVGSTDLKLSSTLRGKLVGTLPSSVMCIPQNKLVSWQTNSESPYKFAVGQSSGKVLIVHHGGSEEPHHKQNSYTTLSPRSGRPCICLSWNPTENHQLAVGMDKARNDSSLVVWDISRLTSSETTPTDRTRVGRPGEMPVTPDDVTKPLESGHGEATSSVAWLPGQASCLAAGMGNRFLRIFDTRDGGVQTKPVQVANHKAILGLSVCPVLPHQLASYAEGSTVYIWDLRHFGKPMYSFTRSATIERLSWLPTRPDCLSIVSKETPFLHLVDIPSFTTASDAQQDVGELYMEHLSMHMRDRHPYYKTKGQYKKLVAVEWHPKRSNVALISTLTGKIKYFHVHDQMALSWTATNGMIYSSSNHLISAATASDDVTTTRSRDISEAMQLRVARGYGFNPAQNVKTLSSDDVILKRLWEWLCLHQELMQSKASPNKGRGSISGVNPVLLTKGSEGVSQSRKTTWDAEGVATKDGPMYPHPIYTSTQRNSALLLCGWSFAGTEQNNLEDFIKREEMSERYERAAAVCVFRGNMRRGIITLTDGANLARQQGNEEKSSHLQLIALSLSGYSPQSSQLWQSTCLQLKSQVSSPYLRAVFGFLSSSGRDDFRDVTNDSKISLQDRVAFACTYLDDSRLQIFLSSLTKQLVESGDISALFLTGLSDPPSDGLALLKNYVNQTGDVQTACLIAGQVSGIGKDRTVQGWFQGYRGLLDQWQMWKERAAFDGQRKARDPTYKPPRQASVTCHFCSKTISSEHNKDRRGPHLASSRKSTSCPNCRKPLPRCALCLLHMVAMGTRQPGDKGAGGGGGGRGGQSDVFGQWFTWCQSCRHGGHANHISQWFSSHDECPVTGCSCNCYALDSGCHAQTTVTS